MALSPGGGGGGGFKARRKPLAPELAKVLLRHRRRSLYKGQTDFVFAGDSGRPRWKWYARGDSNTRPLAS